MKRKFSLQPSDFAAKMYLHYLPMTVKYVRCTSIAQITRGCKTSRVSLIGQEGWSKVCLRLSLSVTICTTVIIHFPTSLPSTETTLKLHDLQCVNTLISYHFVHQSSYF